MVIFPTNRVFGILIVTEERVRWAISLFAPFKSPGIDNIYPALIQKGIDIILQ